MTWHDADESLDELVRDHLPETLRFAVRLTGDPHEAEDVVQEALIRVTRSWKSFRAEAGFRTWLFRIVINVFRDRLRSHSPHLALSDELPDSAATSPETQAAAVELKRLIAELVSALPPRQREVLVLLTYEGFSPQDVSELLSISVANVYATLHVARERLRTQLAPYLVEK